MEKQYWVKHVTGLALEGGSVPAYARAHGISADCLYYWRRKLNKKSSQLPSKAAGQLNPNNKFVSLRIAGATNVAQRITPSDAGNCTLRIGNAIRLDMAALPTPEWLASLALSTQGVR
jgi:transposase-like protein